MASCKRVAVIGAGASGLVAIKCCLDEGYDVVCLERADDIGGLWNYTESISDGHGCVMKSTVINTSKEIMAYSDYPAPKDFPNFMHNTKLMQYFRQYADHFELLQYIKFGVEVKTLKKSSDYDDTGRWTITTSTKEGENCEDFDAVLVCTGHHADKNVASFPDEELFKGKRMHTHDYRSHKGFEDKRVLIIGIGNSGGDMAVELSKISKQVYLSTRRGSWVLNRVGPNGQPGDIYGLRRAGQILPLAFQNYVMESFVNERFNHIDYGLQPKHRPLSGHPTVNDELPNRIISGTVIIKPNVERFTETGVVFTDGTKEDDIDIIVYATGYKFGFPFIDDPALEVKDNKLPMYKYMYPPDFKHHTLAVIGYVQPWGAINPLSELQCRLATRQLKVKNLLPPVDKMWEDIKAKEAEMAARYYEAPRHTIQVDFIPYIDELAELVGCRPDIKHLWLTDPVLAFKVFFGPCTPYQFRLMGPGAWSGAREAIMTQDERIAAPFQTRRSEVTKSQFSLWYIALGMVIVAWIIYFL